MMTKIHFIRFENSVCSNITNETSLCPDLRCDLNALDILFILVYCIILVTGAIGNSLVIYIFSVKVKKLSKPDTIIYYLAIFDFGCSIFVPVNQIYQFATCHLKWPLGNIGCKIMSQLFTISIAFTYVILALLVFDRCLAICRPLGWQIPKKMIKYILLALLVITTAISAPRLVSWNAKRRGDTVSCALDY